MRLTHRTGFCCIEITAYDLTGKPLKAYRRRCNGFLPACQPVLLGKQALLFGNKGMKPTFTPLSEGFIPCKLDFTRSSGGFKGTKPAFTPLSEGFTPCKLGFTPLPGVSVRSNRGQRVMKDKDTLRSEYPAELIKSGERGKYVKSYREGTNIVVIAPEELPDIQQENI